jgi:hypothetical protein
MWPEHQVKLKIERSEFPKLPMGNSLRRFKTVDLKTVRNDVKKEMNVYHKNK